MIFSEITNQHIGISPAYRGAAIRSLGSWGFAAALYCAQFAVGGDNNAEALSLVFIFGTFLASVATFYLCVGRPKVIRPKVAIVSFVLICFSVPMIEAIFMLATHQVNYTYLPSVTATFEFDFTRELIELIKLMGLFCIFGVSSLIICSDSSAYDFSEAICFFGLLYGMWSIFIHYHNPNLTASLTKNVLYPERLVASFDSPNTAGTFFGTILIFTLSYVLHPRFLTKFNAYGRGVYLERAILSALLPCIAGFIAFSAIILTGSRSALIFTFISSLLIIGYWVFIKRSKLFPRRSAIFLSVFLSLALMFCFEIYNGPLWHRTGGLAGDINLRSEIYKSHLSVILQNVLFGHGLGSFASLNRSILTATNYQELWPINAMHNVYLQWLEGTGVVGSLPIFLCIITLLFLNVTTFAKYRSRASCCLAVFGGSILLCLHGFLDFALENYSIALWWCALLGVGYSRWAEYSLHETKL